MSNTDTRDPILEVCDLIGGTLDQNHGQVAIEYGPYLIDYENKAWYVRLKSDLVDGPWLIADFSNTEYNRQVCDWIARVCPEVNGASHKLTFDELSSWERSMMADPKHNLHALEAIQMCYAGVLEAHLAYRAGSDELVDLVFKVNTDKTCSCHG